jgi:glycosyl hydrolase family 123
MKSVFSIAIGITFFFFLSCSKNTITIHSLVLRNRVVVLDNVVMKKALYVAFSLPVHRQEVQQLRVKSQLLHKGNKFSESQTTLSDSANGNIVFDLPYDLPDGVYTVTIDVMDTTGKCIASGFKNADRTELKSTLDSKQQVKLTAYQEIRNAADPHEFVPADREKIAGYVIFARPPFEYVFPESRPKKTEVTDRLSVEVVRNKFEPIAFSLYPLRDLGTVKLIVTDLVGTNGTIRRESMKMAYIESIRDSTGLPPGKYQTIPELVKQGSEVKVENGKCRTFLLTIRINRNVMPGIYKGIIYIVPAYGRKAKLHLTVNVSPLFLEDIPGKDYFMMMTYEFTELTMPWSAQEKKEIYKSAVNILQDYREHGMTTLCIHSPFVMIAKDDGTPNLEDIFAAIKAAKDLGFNKPLIWYMGHLIQTAKPKHPGNILAFEEGVHIPRLEYLVKKVSEYAWAEGRQKVIYMPIDEPDDAYQDVNKRRENATPLLLKAIEQAGGMSMLTAGSYKQFQPISYLCSYNLDTQERDIIHRANAVFWMYNNDVTTQCMNPAYARYIYGYYTWKHDLDGMSSWTFQNTQNANGPPATAGGIGSDVYLAYPDPRGPIATLRWEAIREGIDDHKLIFQLMKRVAKLKKERIDASKYDDFMAELKKKEGEPSCDVRKNDQWDANFFEKNKEAIIALILEADKRLARAHH